MGEYGVGIRNDRGDVLVRFCQEEELMISNTWFELPARRLYTWKSSQDTPDHPVRNQIDYILVPKRYRNRVLSVRTYPGSDVESDHNSVVARFRIRLQKLTKTFSNKPNVALLRSEPERQIITDNLKNGLGKALQKSEASPHTASPSNIEGSWKLFRNTVLDAQGSLT